MIGAEKGFKLLFFLLTITGVCIERVFTPFSFLRVEVSCTKARNCIF